MKKILNSFLKRWQILTPKERLFSSIFFLLLIAGLILLTNNLLNKFTTLEPKEGGILRLGTIGRPAYINPVLSQSNDCEKDLIELIYNGLFSVDGKGSLIPKLAEKVEISEDGTSYIVFLKENVSWHDGIPFTADDVVFTLETIQNPNIKSPLRLNWEGVVVEKLGSNVVRFNLKGAYQPFLQNLTLKIIPKHLWENIEPTYFSGAEYNLKPIGTGPYLFESLERTKEGKIINYSLVANDNYFEKKPYISKLIFKFYDTYELVKNGLLKKEIDGFFPLLTEDIDFFADKKNLKINSLILPRYYAIFLNFENPLFQNKSLREALNLAISKQELVMEILKGQALPLEGPITAGFLGDMFDLKAEYSLEKAQEIISHLGLGQSEKDSITFTLSIPDNKELIKVANYIVNCWEKIGVSVELEILPLADLEKTVIQPRSYDALLFGEIIGQNPDLYSFWHSSQITNSGLNLSNYQNQELDKFLETARQTFNEKKRLEDLKNIQEILSQEKPAIFLYNPFYLYLLPQAVKGNNMQYVNFPSEKFADVENWYLYTKRTF
ncbi:MAG: ABC transporter substrate-binding protein [Candidatus Pacebacteria bacterium]|nr:ABC transporter substrate-binding protein [Candidatus Paceibacterota bacterium]